MFDQEAKLAAVILSGGASRRMGSPKALLPYRGHSFLHHLLDVTSHPRIGARRIVLGADAEAITKVVRLAPQEVVVNEQWERGQLSSLHAALRSLPPGTNGILLCLIDHPTITSSLVCGLINRFDSTKNLIVLPSYEGRRGHPVISSSALYDELLQAPLEMGARAVVRAHADEVEEVLTDEEGCVLNINDRVALQIAFRQTDQ